MPADRGLVENVVVDQRGRVDHLDHRRQRQVLGPDAAASLGRQQHQGRPKPLPAQTKAVLGQPVDKGVVAGKLLPQQPLDRFKLLGDRRIQGAESLRNRRPLLAC